MKVKNIKVGDKVKIKNGCTKYEQKHNGETGVIEKVHLHADCSYGNISIILDNQYNKNSAYGYFYFRTGDFDIIEKAKRRNPLSL